MSRTAHCQCESLRVEAQGAYEAVVACSCSACQRRTGSVFGVGVYYPRTQLTLAGESREYVRIADSGQPFRSHFCPTCGTTVYWSSDRDPSRIGIAVGAFADPTFPAPNRSVFEINKHHWVDFGADIAGFERGRDSRKLR